MALHEKNSIPEIYSLGDIDDNEIPDKIKKLTKRQKNEAKWLAKRQKLLEKRKQKNQQRNRNRKQTRKNIRDTVTDCKRHVVIDFSYDSLMSSKDKIRSVSQAVRCYSTNRRSESPFNLHFCSFKGETKSIAEKHDGLHKWNIQLHEEDYCTIFNKSDVVYLSSESKNILNTLEDGKVYIIGGLVDHNAHKGLSLERAEQVGVSHACLPLKDSLPHITKFVLAINHVFDILLNVNGGMNWEDAVSAVMPPRLIQTSCKTSKVEKEQKKDLDDTDKLKNPEES